MRQISIILGVIFCFFWNSNLSGQYIVLGKQPLKLEKLAARELQFFLEKISGGTWSILEEKDFVKEGVSGLAVYLADTDFARRHGVNIAEFGEEEWYLRTVDEKNMMIAGGRPAGSLYGVYAFLEHLGVYFLTMDETTIPHMTKFQFPVLRERRKPAFAGRFIFDLKPFSFRRKGEREADKSYWKFRLRSRLNGHPVRFREALYTGSFFNLTRLIHEYENCHEYVSPELYFKNHPEYFSLDQNGKRIRTKFGGHLCLSNPEVLEIVWQSLVGYIEKDRRTLPRQQWPSVYDFSQNDGGKSLCFCENCQRISRQEGGESGLLLRFVNKLAARLAKDYPDLKLRTFAYSMGDSVPRTMIPAENVIICYCNNYTRVECYRPMRKEDLERIDSWSRISSCLMVWDYWNMGGGFFYPPRPEVMIDAIQPNMRSFRNLKVRGLFLECEKDEVIPQNFIELQYFLASQLMVDPEKNIEQLIDIYLKNYYGAAAPMMKQYLTALRKGIAGHGRRQMTFYMTRWDFMTAKFMKDHYLLFEQALKTVSANTVFYQRVQEEMLPLVWNMIYFWREHGEYMQDNGIVREKLMTVLQEGVKSYLFKYHPEHPEGVVKRWEKQLRLLEANLPCPERFRKYRERMIFAYPNHIALNKRYQSGIVDDPESLQGKSICASHPILAEKKERTMLFGTYDYNEKKEQSVAVQVSDEKYHWYRLPKITISSKSIFWGALWRIQMDLSQAYRLPDQGNDKINEWDLWFRAKFTGPAFVGKSANKNAVFVDMVVLIRPEK